MKYLITAFIFLIFFSCAPDVCNEKITWPVQAGFYAKWSQKADTLIFVDSLSLNGLNNTTFLYKNLKESKIEIPLTILSGSSIFVFKIKSKSDTVTFFHSNTPYLISKQCGYGYQQVIDSVTYTKHALSKITWRVPQVDKNDKENIEIFY